MDNLKEDHREFVKNNKLILKTRQRYRSEKSNIFTLQVQMIITKYNQLIQ